jgi:hypothetical protein
MSVAVTVRAVRRPLLTADGKAYAARICGRRRGDGRWEGWVEFDPDDGAPALRTPRETTQPNIADLRYWAAGLTAVYLEGALQRALNAGRPLAVALDTPEPPAYEGPAPAPATRAA